MQLNQNLFDSRPANQKFWNCSEVIKFNNYIRRPCQLDYTVRGHDSSGSMRGAEYWLLWKILSEGTHYMYADKVCLTD